MITKMHSSRMRTVRSSSRLLGGVSASVHAGIHTPPLCLGLDTRPPRQTPPEPGPGPPGQNPPGLGLDPPQADTPPGLGLETPPVERILDTRLWKHYLSATSFADGNNHCRPLSWPMYNRFLGPMVSSFWSLDDTSQRVYFILNLTILGIRVILGLCVLLHLLNASTVDIQTFFSECGVDETRSFREKTSGRRRTESWETNCEEKEKTQNLNDRYKGKPVLYGHLMSKNFVKKVATIQETSK